MGKLLVKENNFNPDLKEYFSFQKTLLKFEKKSHKTYKDTRYNEWVNTNKRTKDSRIRLQISTTEQIIQ